LDVVFVLEKIQEGKILMCYKKKPDNCGYGISFKWDSGRSGYFVNKIFWQIDENGKKGRRHYLTSMPLDEEKGTILKIGDRMPEDF
jgi:hypothetical protein